MKPHSGGSDARAVVLPKYSDLLWPALEAIRSLGNSGSVDEINESVIAQQGLTEKQQAVPHGEGPQSELEYRLAWARTYLKGMHLLDNSTRGVWATTERGRTVTQSDLDALHREYRKSYQKRPQLRAAHDEEEASGDGSAKEEPFWQERLIGLLIGLQPDAFERLAQRLLRAAGFVNTSVTGRSGDGGIDGVGVYRLSLVSFPVFFQCKKYKGSVGPDKVRDFRGAMQGRGDKGLLITTGTFTSEAKRESTRDGAPPIDLIDGERLCELLKEYSIGLTTVTKTIEDVQIDESFYRSL